MLKGKISCHREMTFLLINWFYQLSPYADKGIFKVRIKRSDLKQIAASLL